MENCKPYILNWIKNQGGGSSSSNIVIDGQFKFATSVFNEFPDFLAKATYTGNLYKTLSEISVPSIPDLNVVEPTRLDSFLQNSIFESVGLFDLGDVTSIQYMFSGCSNLKSIPLYDTSKITDFRYLFYNCTNLEDVPLLDTSKSSSSGFRYLFNKNSSKLTNDSLNNILKMCINAVNVSSSYKNLATVGLSSDQATACAELSNWQDFLDAGWTTGY